MTIGVFVLVDADLVHRIRPMDHLCLLYLWMVVELPDAARFNDTIGCDIGCDRLDASEAEIEGAAREAERRDVGMSLPDRAAILEQPRLFRSPKAGSPSAACSPFQRPPPLSRAGLREAASRKCRAGTPLDLVIGAEADSEPVDRTEGTFQHRGKLTSRRPLEVSDVAAGLQRGRCPIGVGHAVRSAESGAFHPHSETNMSSNMVLGIILIVVGVVAIFFGWNQSQSLVDQASETFTGRFTESTMWYFFAGAAALAGGAALLVMGRRR